MCGIFGYVGLSSQKSKGKSQKFDKSAAEIVFEGLKSLEYRGYDSWGMVVKVESQSGKSRLIVEKHVGKIGNSHSSLLITHLSRAESRDHSSLALGHTRWATHGGVTGANAHPHLDCKGTIAVVHNGIVENYQQLRKKLSKNHKFKSETDTEIVVHLVEELAQKHPFEAAVRQAFLQVKGLNAFIFVKGGEIVAVKSGSPLVIGVAKGENFIASDPSALLPHTKKAIFLEENQIARVFADRVELRDVITSGKITPKINKLDWKIEEIDLGKFAHYMLKEIYEQPRLLRLISQNGEGVKALAKVVNRAHGTFFIGCGTASYAALSGSYLFSTVAHKHVNFAIGSEFNYLEDYLDKDSLVIAISQSGETIDVVQPAARAKEKGAKVVALTNVQGSTLYRLADHRLMLWAGVERAVCATKSFSAMAANMIYLSFTCSGQANRGRIILKHCADAVADILKADYVNLVKKLANKLRKQRDIYVIGRGLSYATALEATLKLKEVPYVHSEGFAGGELKHGVIALIEKGTPCIVFAPNDETYDDIISNAIEIKSRGGYIIGISPKRNEIFDYFLPVADVGEASIIANTVPIQLLAYYLAIEKKLDPDKPRNLAKSVTVK